MIDFSILPVFILAAILLVISPGPDLLLISAYSSARGFKSGLMIVVGIFLAGVAQSGLVAFGLGKLMQAMPPLIIVIKSVGALYLSWLGINLIRKWRKRRTEFSSVGQVEQLSSKQLVIRGLLNNLMNPKAILFFSMFLPQFSTGSSDITYQVLVLGLLLSGIALVVNSSFAFAFSKLSHYVSRRFRVGRHADGILGLIFLGLAARLAVSE